MEALDKPLDALIKEGRKGKGGGRGGGNKRAGKPAATGGVRMGGLKIRAGTIGKKSRPQASRVRR